MLRGCSYIPYIYKCMNIRTLSRFYDHIKQKSYIDLINFSKGLYLCLSNTSPKNGKHNLMRKQMRKQIRKYFLIVVINSYQNKIIFPIYVLMLYTKGIIKMHHFVYLLKKRNRHFLIFIVVIFIYIIL